MTRTDLRGSQDTRGCARKERVPRVSSAASATASGAPSWRRYFDVTWKRKKRLGINTIRTYAVTAHHVIKGFQAQAEADGVAAEGYFLPAAPGVLIDPPFVRPPEHYPHPRPDIALRPIDRSKLPAGKNSHKLARLSPTFPVPYALAAGFPTAAKETLPNSAGEQLKMVGVLAIAEGVGSLASSQVQFYSEVKREKISGDVNGMSGGPVFWNDGNAYGLLGFVKEAMVVEQNGNDEMAMVHFICQRADYNLFASWASYADELLRKNEQL